MPRGMREETLVTRIFVFDLSIESVLTHECILMSPIRISYLHQLVTFHDHIRDFLSFLGEKG